MSHDELKKIREMRKTSPEEALEKLNKLTGIRWERMPVSLKNHLPATAHK